MTTEEQQKLQDEYAAMARELHSLDSKELMIMMIIKLQRILDKIK